MDENASREFLESEVSRLRALASTMNIVSVQASGWDVFVEFQSLKRNTLYTVRLRCDNGYPLTPPSVSFVSPSNTADSGRQFWPVDGDQAFKVGNNPPFICLPGIREYHERHQGAPPSRSDVSLSRIVSELVSRANR